MSATHNNTWTHADLAAACGGAQSVAGGSFKATCPTHQDKVQSLHISDDNGKILVKCMAGCNQDTLWAACVKLMGGEPEPRSVSPALAQRKPVVITPAPQELDIADITHSQFGTPTLVYEYRDQDGNLHFYNCRFEFPEGTPQREKFGSKTHRPYSCVHNPQSLTQQHYWHFCAPAKQARIPYRLDQLKPEGIVLVHEGEKAANAGAQLAPAISHLGWWGGASNVLYTDWTCLSGRKVWLLPDADAPRDGMPDGAGIAAMDNLRDTLTALDCDVVYCRDVKQAMRVMGLNPDEHPGFDAADILELGWTYDKFTQFLNIAATEIGLDPSTYDQPTAADVVNTFNQSMEEAHQRQSTATFLPLGYNKDTYYYLSRATKQIHVLSPQSHKKANLLSICPHESFWSTYVPPAKKGPDYEAAMMRMMSECHKAGLFDQELIRGRGAWFDNGKVVLHLGNRLIIDDEPADILTRPGKYIYEQAATVRGPGDDIMPDDECEQLYDICRQFCWERPESADYLMGWIMLAPICGAIDWRPHIWLSGPSGAGKSTIQERFVKPLLGNMVLMVQGASTEAGIRQKLQHDALPVIMDESEQEDDSTRRRGESIIQMIRQASSDTDAKTLKGGASGNATSYHIRSMFMLASVAIGLQRSADMNRVAQLLLTEATPENKKNWPSIRTRLDNITPDVSSRMIKRAITLVPTIRQNAALLAHKIRIVASSSRVGDQYGALLAGSEAFKHTRILTDAEADEIVKRHDVTITAQREFKSYDEAACLNYLSQAMIRMERESGPAVNLSIRELINYTHNGHATYKATDADMALQRHGLRVDKESGVLKVATHHRQLDTLFEHTPWAIGRTQHLKRIEGVTEVVSRNGNPTKVRFAGGAPQNAIQIPLNLIVSEEDLVADDMPF